jgi:hypothetical protein
MKRLRKATVAALAVAAAFAVGAPAANAQFPIPTGSAQGISPTGNTAIAPGNCTTPVGAEGLGGTAGTTNMSCIGAGLSFIGPSIGQVASVVGPVIIGPSFVRTAIVSAGNGNGG